MAVMSWWHDIQPGFRKTEGLTPADTVIPLEGETGDTWGGLRKPGPNGMLSVMTLLFWWGRAAQVVDRWEDDSRGKWRAMVVDVRRVMERMTGSGQKRLQPVSSSKNKRYVMIYRHHNVAEIKFLH